jgi:FkbM family methyltransferase
VSGLKLTARQRASWLAHLFKAATQQHHRELIPLFAPHIPAEAVVFDVGAHAGQFAKLFARLARRGRVYAFEPSAYARSILVPALTFNRLANVTVVPLALAEAAGEAALHTPLKASSAWGFGLAHLGAAGEPGVDQSVRLTTLDAFAAAEHLTRLDFIKADIEGWEMRALVGGEASLRRFRPALFLEVDDRFLARAGDTPQALFAWLAGIGYSASPPSWTGPGDYLFVATEKAPI